MYVDRWAIIPLTQHTATRHFASINILTNSQVDAERELAGAEEIERAEIERMMTVGFTKAEAECWVIACKLAYRFFELPELHPADDHEVTHATHVVQNRLRDWLVKFGY